jgi:glycosyltransferase involved in cell wall biosynthesis/ubiquinone/menaquinone biosynthesis C-methylase UbiE
MARYLYVGSDLARSGVFESSALASAVERHMVPLTPPLLRPVDAGGLNRAIRSQVDGVVLQPSSGLLDLRQLDFARATLRAGKPVWLYWPSEQAVERLDDERWRSYRRHARAQKVLQAIDRAIRPLVALRRMPAATLWAYRGEFRVPREEMLARLDGLFAIARPVAWPCHRWTPTGIDGVGLYVRADFWNQLTSGGSYGHTCYVANELKKSSCDVVCLLAQHYPLLDDLGVRQVVMDLPRRTDGEDPIAEATRHYYPIVKAACQVMQPAYIYERLCLGNYAAALASRELQIPYVVEYNGSEISMQKSFQGATPYRYQDVYQAAEAFAFRQAAVISVVSSIVRDDLIARGVDASKIVVNPNGADLDAYSPAAPGEKNRIREALGVEDRHSVVGFSATFGGWHGVDVLAAAIPRICESAPDVRFLLIGDGVHKPLIDEAVARHGLADRVRAVGRVPQAEGARLLRACDLYVAPHNAHMVDSKFFGSPTKLFEYMAMGGGIVASDLEQMGEVLSPALRAADLGRDSVEVGSARAVLCTPGDVDEFVGAVVLLASRPAVAAALGANARQAVRDHYSWARHVERLWSFARSRARAAAPTLDTGEAYKNEVQHQWNNTPIGSDRAKQSQPHTLAWFQEIERDRYASYAPWMPEVMEFAHHAGDEVLEIGGGLGIDLAQFASHGAKVTDVDLSATHLALAEEHFRLRGLQGRFVHHDAESLPFPESSFDLVYSNGVIHHSPNTQAIVDEIFRVLRPGGRALVMVYAERSWNYWWKVMFARGMKEGQLGQHSMGHILSGSVENTATDARPLVKVYTSRRLRQMFRRFAHVRIVQRQLRRDELPGPLALLQPVLERTLGWNLIVKATRPRR